MAASNFIKELFGKHAKKDVYNLKWQDLHDQYVEDRKLIDALWALSVSHPDAGAAGNTKRNAQVWMLTESFCDHDLSVKLTPKLVLNCTCQYDYMEKMDQLDLVEGAFEAAHVPGVIEFIEHMLEM